jgi:hypothetical protein
MNMQRDLQDGNEHVTQPPELEEAGDNAECDYIHIDFHLTPNGWVMGDIRCLLADVNLTKPEPIDRVLTLTHRTSQVSPDSPRLCSVTVAWRGDATDAQIAELRAKFPPPFDPADE